MKPIASKKSAKFNHKKDTSLVHKGSSGFSQHFWLDTATGLEQAGVPLRKLRKKSLILFSFVVAAWGSVNQVLIWSVMCFFLSRLPVPRCGTRVQNHLCLLFSSFSFVFAMLLFSCCQKTPLFVHSFSALLRPAPRHFVSGIVLDWHRSSVGAYTLFDEFSRQFVKKTNFHGWWSKFSVFKRFVVSLQAWMGLWSCLPTVV